MALQLPAKAPGEVLDYTWQPPIDADDSLSSYTAQIAGATLDDVGQDGDDVVMVISGGTAGAVATITLTAVTVEGDTFNETLYIPIRAATVVGETVERVISFAMRKIKGVGRNANAVETDHALECLADMLRAWRAQGADIGAAEPLTVAGVLTCSDSDLETVKNNLIVRLSDLYDRPVTESVAFAARAGLQQIKQRNLSADRDGAEFF